MGILVVPHPLPLRDPRDNPLTWCFGRRTKARPPHRFTGQDHAKTTAPHPERNEAGPADPGGQPYPSGLSPLADNRTNKALHLNLKKWR